MGLIWADPDRDEVKTTCKLCLNYCGMMVKRTGNGIIVKGDPSHPLSMGFLCQKGRAALDVTGQPDRIKHPLRRIGSKGSQKWERISWEEAINGIASELKDILQKYGAKSVLVNSLPPKDPVLWLAFAKAIGTPNYFRHDHHICFTPQVIADTLTFGNVTTYLSLTEEDVPKMRTVVLWGVNMHETNPAKALVIEHAQKSGAKVIVIDPRPTKSAEMADIWLRVKPATDVVLALGMMNVIIRENLYDAEFVEKWTYGFDKLVKHVAEYPPDKAAEITGVDEAMIIKVARLIATRKPSAVITFIGLAMGGNSVNSIRSLGILSAITGNIDIAGGNFIKILPATNGFSLSKELLKEQIGAEKFPLLSGPSALTGAFPSGHPALVMDAILTGEPYPVRALFTNANPMTALEDSMRVKEAMKQLDLLVVFELFMTPTAEFADYVLPVTWFLESNAISQYMGLNFIAARKRVLDPIGEAREEGEILLDILEALGLRGALPFSKYEEYLDYRLDPLKVNFDEFVKKGFIVNPNIERKYEKGLLRTDKKPGFNTPTGKIEIYSTILEKYGYDSLPAYRKPFPASEVSKDYPFILITGTRSLPIYHGLGLQIPSLRKLHPDPLLEISPVAAERLGIGEGDRVAIEVPGKRDVVHRKAHIVQELSDIVVCAEGHWFLPEEKHDQQKRLWDASINVLTRLGTDYDPIIGGSGSRRLLCRISKA